MDESTCYEVIYKGPTCTLFGKPPSRRVVTQVQMTKNKTNISLDVDKS